MKSILRESTPKVEVLSIWPEKGLSVKKGLVKNGLVVFPEATDTNGKYEESGTKFFDRKAVVGQMVIKAVPSAIVWTGT